MLKMFCSVYIKISKIVLKDQKYQRKYLKTKVNENEFCVVFFINAIAGLDKMNEKVSSQRKKNNVGTCV